MMKIETRNISLDGLEIRASDKSNSRRAVGYAAVWNSNSDDIGGFVERIEKGAFKRSLTAAASNDLNIFALWAHDRSLPLGSTSSGKLVLIEDERGLGFDLDISRFTPAQLDALEDNDLRMSFGFRVREENWEEKDDGSIIRTLIDVDLIEVSFVINPAYSDTEAALRSLDAWKEVRAKGESEDTEVDITEQLKRVLMLKLSLRGR